MKKSILTALAGTALVATLLAAPSRAEAQSASITATATVATALTVTNVRDLDFGMVFPGFARVIVETDATSGHFSLAGGANAEIAISFSSLPAALSNGVPADDMPVAYTATYNTTDAAGVGTGFAPGGGVTTRLDAATGELHAYIGGTLTVGGTQTPGLYTATVTMDAAYTGS